MAVLAEAFKEERLSGISISLVVCDRPGAPVLGNARNLGLPCCFIDPAKYKLKSSYESEILHQLDRHRIDLVVLTGYMRIVGPKLLEVWKGRMINLHPSLLPDFPGKDGIGDAYRAGVSVTGVTVHFVDEGVDTGPVIAHRKVKVESDESQKSLEKKIHRAEYLILPETIRMIEKEGIRNVWFNVAKACKHAEKMKST